MCYFNNLIFIFENLIKKLKKNHLLFIALFIFNVSVLSQTTLSHNIGDNLVNTGMFSCGEPEYFARTFTLSDFGISGADEFVISSGNFGIARSFQGAMARFNIYAIDDNFPDSFDDTNLLGSSQFQIIPYVWQYGPPLLITINFDDPVIIPIGTGRILVEVHKIDNPNEIATPLAHFAGTTNDNDISWYKGCGGGFNGIYTYLPSGSLSIPKPNAKFYITVNGEINSRILNDNTCVGSASTFQINTSQIIDSILWNFGDGNTSSLESPTHTYNTTGSFTVSATFTSGLNVSTETSTVTINESPIVNSPIAILQCDDNLDGFSSFNLTELNSEISTNHLNETITFYETQLDAEDENSPIPNATEYINENSNTDTIWARVENSNGCFSMAEVNLEVTTSQIPSTFFREFYQCDDGLDTTDGIATFNFSAVTAEIETELPSGQVLDISYFNNEQDALLSNNPIVDISNHQNIGYPNSQDIYVRVENAMNRDCIAFGHYITLNVENIPVINNVIIPEQCDSDGDTMYAFDTSSIQSDLIGSQTNVTVSYTDENGIVLSSPLPNPFNTATQTITVRVTYATSQDPDGACYDETTIDFVVDAAAVANPIADIMECDDDNDGQFAFDTSTLETTILNGQTGMQVTYTDEAGNLLSSPLPNPFVSATQILTVRVENILSATCYDETTINLIVNEQPIANTIQDDIVCDNASNDGEHNYTLTDYDTQILDTQSSTIFEVIYFDNLTNAENNVSPLPYTYLSTSTSETIYARIHNRSNIDCYAITTFQIGVSYLPMAYQPEDFVVCDDATNDGEAEFVLSNQNIDILNGQSATENIITYHLSEEDADNNTNALASTFTNTEAFQILYARIENRNNTDCYATTSFNIIVVEQPVLLMEEQWPICEGDTVEIIADSGFDEYLWSNGETTPSIVVDQIGPYEVTVTNIYGTVRCEDSQAVTVVQSDIALITNIETIDWSQSNNEIIVTVFGNGDYEYSIDGFNYQDSNQFTNLNAGEFLVYVRDKNGCGIVKQEVYLMYYPLFFTPNNDGYNDSWQLLGSKNEPANKIYIYDRYGKLLKQLSPTDTGWDGTFNGNTLPTSDYWFLLERQNGKQHQGHFTLKR